MTSQPPTPPRGELTPLPDIEQFQMWLGKWGRLLLPDWELSVRFVRLEELSNREHIAEFIGHYEHFSGEVCICNEHRRGDWIAPHRQDWEHTLVHELLHGVLDFPVCQFLDYTNELQRNLYENRINRLARALVTADRAIPAD